MADCRLETSCDGDGTVAEKMAAELSGEIAQGLLHGCLLSLSGAYVYNGESRRMGQKITVRATA